MEYKFLTKEDILDKLSNYEFDHFTPMMVWMSVPNPNYVNDKNEKPLTLTSACICAELIKNFGNRNRGKQIWRLCTRRNAEIILEKAREYGGVVEIGL